MSGLPRGWIQATLGDVVSLRGEKRNPLELCNWVYLGLEDVEPHTSKILRYCRAGDFKSSANMFSSGDILYGRLRPYLNKVAMVERDGLASAEFLVLIPQSGVSPEYIQRRIKSQDFQDFTATLDKGDRPRVDFHSISDFKITLPPVSEQRRIVAKLDALDASSKRARADLDRIPALVARAKQAMLAKAFRGDLTADYRASGRMSAPQYEEAELYGEKKRKEAWRVWASEQNSKRRYKPPQSVDWTPDLNLPEGWCWLSVDQLCAASQYGSSAKTNDDTAGVPVLRMGNIQDGRLGFSNLKFLPQGHSEFPELLLKEGDLLFVAFRTIA